MATFYADHDTSVHVAAGLGRLGHATATAYGLQQRLAHDAQQLLTAVELGAILLTCNGRDFLLLHQAWVLWPRALGLTPFPEHPGILVIPQQPGRVPAIVQEIDAFLGTSPVLHNRLYAWRPTAGWVERS